MLGKVEGLDERAARWPWAPTGTNLLGLVKHAAGVEVGCFGRTFGRERASPHEMPWTADDAEADADMWATVDEPVDAVVDLYRRVWVLTHGSAGLRADDDNLSHCSAADRSRHVDRLRTAADEAQRRSRARGGDGAGAHA